MTHYRRYNFKKHHSCCATPAVATLRDFDDSFVEALRNRVSASQLAEESDEPTANQANGATQLRKLQSSAALLADSKIQFDSAKWISDSELIFSLSNQVGGLVRALRIFQASIAHLAISLLIIFYIEANYCSEGTQYRSETHRVAQVAQGRVEARDFRRH